MGSGVVEARDGLRPLADLGVGQPELGVDRLAGTEQLEQQAALGQLDHLGGLASGQQLERLAVETAYPGADQLGQRSILRPQERN